jgi:hypothetical protein
MTLSLFLQVIGLGSLIGGKGYRIQSEEQAITQAQSK